MEARLGSNPTPEDRIRSFFDLDGLTRAIETSGFDVEEEITTLIDLVRSQDPKIALTAHRSLMIRIREAAALNGLVGQYRQMQEKTDAQTGVKTRQVASAQRLLNARAAERNSLAPRVIPDYLPALGPTTPVSDSGPAPSHPDDGAERPGPAGGEGDPRPRNP